ncbi:MAG: hypothetical protein ACKOW3_04040 [Hyphomicrobium sp.]
MFKKLTVYLFVLTSFLFLTHSAEAVRAKVREACRDDYLRFCPAYEPETPKGRQCMRQAGRRLSKQCLDALSDSGQIRRGSR